MSRSKQKDLEIIESFLQALKEFKKLKMEKWEKVDDQMQASNELGSPTEDWIIPPDEEKTKKILENDPQYASLRNQIQTHKNCVTDIAKFIGADLHHSFQWLNFNNPLIGQAALEDCIDTTENLKGTCQGASYWIQNLKRFFS